MGRGEAKRVRDAGHSVPHADAQDFRSAEASACVLPICQMIFCARRLFSRRCSTDTATPHPPIEVHAAQVYFVVLARFSAYICPLANVWLAPMRRSLAAFPASASCWPQPHKDGRSLRIDHRHSFIFFCPSMFRSLVSLLCWTGLQSIF